MADNAIRIQFEEIRSVAFGDISGAFVAIGNPFEHPIRVVKVVNTTNAEVIISYDGLTEHDVLPSGSFTLYDWCANKSDPAGGAFQAVGTQVWVLSDGSPSSGNVYVVAAYATGAVY